MTCTFIKASFLREHLEEKVCLVLSFKYEGHEAVVQIVDHGGAHRAGLQPLHAGPMVQPVNVCHAIVLCRAGVRVKISLKKGWI